MVGPFSCDTSVVVGSATVDGSVIFAKNSDRPANECQPLSHEPRRNHPAGSTLRCQYLEIPQVAETWELIGSRPSWLWGFEIGVNEWGVAIGNEAVHTREPYDDPALIGMDLVRLGLERATTADAAVATIGELVERHGQGGSCDAWSFRTYQNSFIVADPRSAWVVETAGRRWIARRVEDRAAISNLLTIESDYHTASHGIVEHAVAQGWSDTEFSFAAAYQDPEADLTPRVCRLMRAREVLAGFTSKVDVPDMMNLLRDHGSRGLPTGPDPLPTICMHANPAFPGETAAAIVAHLRPGRPRELTATVWTAFGSPCLSIFRPVYPFAVGLPARLDRGDLTYDSESPWWVFERLQRLVASAPSLAPTVRAALADLEATFMAEAAVVEDDAAGLLKSGGRDVALRRLRWFVESTTERALDLARQLTDELGERSLIERLPAMADFWAEQNANAGVPESAVEPALA